MRLVLLASLACAACVGDIVAPPPAGGEVTTLDPKAEPPRGFTVPQADVQLLPFSVRFARLRAVTGANADDPMFAKLLESRTTLGDYDFAKGVQPDTSWTALKITQWVTALKPVCASMQMRLRYPDLPGNLAQLVEAAYGRAMTADDLTAVNEVTAGIPALTAEERRDGICLAVLSSMEFLAL